MVRMLMAAMVLPCAAAARAEGTAMLQARVTEHDASQQRSEHLANLKAQFLEYAKNGVPEESKQFLTSIEATLRDDLLPSILQEKNLQVQSHDQLYGVFGTATNDHGLANSGIQDSEVPALGAAANAHEACRAQESIDHGEQVDAQAAYDADEATVRTWAAKSVNCLDSDYPWRTTAAGNLDTYEADLGHYQTAVNRLIGTRTTLNAKDDDLARQKATCDTNQQTFERAACAHSQIQRDTNNAYTIEYNEAKAAFESQFGTWDEQSGDREAQCQLVNDLICMIQALHDNDDQVPLAAAVEACSGSARDCSGMTFAHSSTPLPDVLTDVPVAPCDGFNHGPMPAGTALAACESCSVADAVAFN